MKKLYVGNLAWAVTDEDLQSLFSDHGGVASASRCRCVVAAVASRSQSRTTRRMTLATTRSVRSSPSSNAGTVDAPRQKAKRRATAL